MNAYTFVERFVENGTLHEREYCADTREDALRTWHDELSWWHGIFEAVTE